VSAHPPTGYRDARDAKELLWLADRQRKDGNSMLTMGEAEDAARAYSLGVEYVDSVSAGDAAGSAELLVAVRALRVALQANLAQALIKQGLWAEGLNAADAALAVDARHEKALFRRARCLSELGRRGEALTALEALTAAYPGNGPAVQMLHTLAAGMPPRVTEHGAAGGWADEPVGDNADNGGAPLLPPGARGPRGTNPDGPSELLPSASGGRSSSETAADESGRGSSKVTRRPQRGADSTMQGMARALSQGGLYADAPNYDRPLARAATRRATAGRGGVLDAAWAAVAWAGSVLCCPCRRGLEMWRRLAESVTPVRK
jgi:tetratricopeptide (TPR) repeat protein